MSNLKVRNPAMDIVRCFALFCVISVHFFLNSGFYNETVSGEKMYILTLMRSFFMICVPLFMLLSGFLSRKKKITKSYYFKLSYTLGIYILASIACLIYRIYIKGEDIAISQILYGFFSFENAPYSWYIEMYIGLFLLSPFLNVLYNNIDSKRKKQVLVLTMILLTAIPSITNIYQPNIEWFLNPASSSKYLHILPDWWITLYPITYYFIGCYLSEYKIKLRVRYQVLLLFLVIILNGTFNFYRSYNSTFIQGFWQNYYGITQVIQTVLVFSIFANLNYSKFPPILSKFFAKISGLCLGGYLVSWIFDNYFYPILIEKIPKMTDRLPFYFVMVPLVFACSLLLSWVINLIYNLCENIVKSIFAKPQKTT